MNMRLFISLKNAYMNMSIRYKMIMINSFIIFFVALIIGTASFFLYLHTITNELAVINLRDVKQVGNNIDYIQNDVKELSSFICSDSIVQKTICYSPDELNNNPSDQNYVEYMLNNLLVSKSYVSFISLYADNGFTYYAATDKSNNIPSFNTLKGTDIYKRTAELKGASLWAYIPKADTTYILDNKNSKISMCRTVLKLNDYSRKGFIMLSMNLSAIMPMYEGTLTSKGSTMMFLDKHNTPFFIDPELDDVSSVTNLLNKIPDSVMNQSECSEIYNYNGQKYLITFTSLKSADWKVLNIVPLDSFTTNAGFVPLFALITSLLTLFLGFYFTTYASSLFTKPIKNLLQSMRRVKSGNFKEFVGFKYRDEIGLLGAEYDQMISRIHDLIHEVYVLELEEKIAELKALQAQINPHFLYNTLDTIYWKAVAGDTGEVKDMIHALSKVFRLALNVGNEFLTVSKEKEFIDHYILLQEKRYKNKLKYILDFSPAIMDDMIPKLILQPFVENAIVHGLETEAKQTTISILGYEADKKLHFIITDDGPGIPESVLQKIIDPSVPSNPNPKKGGYGIKNVIKRLSLYYSDEYKLDFKSKVGEGTTIHIILPPSPVLTIREGLPDV